MHSTNSDEHELDLWPIDEFSGLYGRSRIANDLGGLGESWLTFDERVCAAKRLG